MTDELAVTSGFRIHPDARPGWVHLAAGDLAAQLAFYTRVIGLQVHWRKDGEAGLGAGGPDLLRLSETPGARRYRGVTGLYHFAILLPSRLELARAVRRLQEMRISNYPTDHIMTKTTYLEDPEGNQIELYAESPEDGTMYIEDGVFRAVRADGTLSDGREPLDTTELFRCLPPGEPIDLPMPPETRLGHIHLHVADLDRTMHFYHGLLGFDDMGIARLFRMGMVSAGRYHHHIGFNTWVGEGAPRPPKDALGLRHFTFHLPDENAWEALQAHLDRKGVKTQPAADGLELEDPSGNRIVFTRA